MRNFCLNAVDERGISYPFEVREDGAHLYLTLKKENLVGTRQLRALGHFTAALAGEEGFYLQPCTEKSMGDFLTRFTPREDTTYLYQKPVLSLFGLKKEGLLALVRIERNYKYKLETVVKDGTYRLAVLFDFTEKDALYDDIRMEIVLLDPKGSYAELARAERELRMARGEITLLAEKCKTPAVEYARKYPLIRIRMGWKPSPSPVAHQTLENEPLMHVACTFARVRDIADELKRQGVEGAELQLVGWNIGGHDGRFPQLFPADPRFGGDAELARTVDYVKSLGYRISLHTNLIDSYEIAEDFSFDDVVVARNGSYRQIGHFSGGDSYRVCPLAQLRNNRLQLAQLEKLGLDGVHFTDVVSIVVPDDCHAPGHPVTTAHAVGLMQQIIRETRNSMGAFSSEGAMDFALGSLDYALYITFGDGFSAAPNPVADVILPFWELVYHGTVLYNPMSPTVNYPIKTPRERLITYLCGGRPTLYFFSKFKTGGAANWMGETDLVTTTDEELRHAVSVVKLALEEYRAGGFDERQHTLMTDYVVSENGVEAAFYADGTVVAGNFGTECAEFHGVTLPAGEYRVL